MNKILSVIFYVLITAYLYVNSVYHCFIIVFSVNIFRYVY